MALSKMFAGTVPLPKKICPYEFLNYSYKWRSTKEMKINKGQKEKKQAIVVILKYSMILEK